MAIERLIGYRLKRTQFRASRALRMKNPKKKMIELLLEPLVSALSSANLSGNFLAGNLKVRKKKRTVIKRKKIRAKQAYTRLR